MWSFKRINIASSGTNPYPLPAGTFESMTFLLPQWDLDCTKGVFLINILLDFRDEKAQGSDLPFMFIIVEGVETFDIILKLLAGVRSSFRSFYLLMSCLLIFRQFGKTSCGDISCHGSHVDNYNHQPYHACFIEFCRFFLFFKRA